MKTTKIFLCIFLLSLFSCTKTVKELPLIDPEAFQGEQDGKKVELFTLKNAGGMVAQITNFGGRVVTLWVPDKNGNFEDVVLGYPTFEAYQKASESYFGTLIGRYGNRIGNAQFLLNDSLYKLAANNGPNSLHGGVKGYNDVVWDAVQNDESTLLLSYLSPDGEEGFPGNLQVNVTYELTADNELKVEYKATTDKPTPVNLTQHSYFNLKGAGNGDILDHILQINSAFYTPVDGTLIPTGELAAIDGTPLDFRTPVAIGARINEDHPQLKAGNGYDLNWVLAAPSDSALTFAARVTEPVSGRTMEVYTNEPGVQFYCGNFMSGKQVGKNNKVYPYRGGLCLETQHFPDSPNKPQFPSVILNPGQEYYSVCVYKFGIQ